jgi:hypothetical protein
MGQEARCLASHGARSAEGVVHLETDYLTFRDDAGDFRLRIPFKDVERADATDGRLTVRFAGGAATFHLGAPAAKWAERIRAPKPLVDKLDVRPGARVALVGATAGAGQDELRGQLAERAETIAVGRPRKESDAIFLWVESERDLARVGTLEPYMKRDGALWVIHPKGKAGIPDTTVFAAAKAAGFTYTKVARVSDTHTAEKLVIPKERR